MAFVDLVIIALIASVVILVAQRQRNATPAGTPRPADPEAQRLAAEVTELRARIHILERAITDDHGSTDLTQEIERLRDR